MAVGNSLQTPQNQPKFSVAIQKDGYKKLMNDTLGDPERVRRFVSAVSSAVGINPALQECEAASILTAALLGEALNLSPSPQLGQYYMVPYNDKKRGKVAQFQLGYKGLIQLAIRSGQYLDMDVFTIHEGEYKGSDKMTRRPILEFIEDDEQREALPVVGYYAYFELLNGFRKCMYWSREKMEVHADRYSKAFSLAAYRKMNEGLIAEGDMWKFSSFWYKDFDAMAAKTMLRQLISKWGVMSIDLQRAVVSDEALIHADPNFTPEYFDNPESAELPPTVVDGEAGDVVPEHEPEPSEEDGDDPLGFFGKERGEA